MNFKGRIQTNKMLLNLQLAQEFNTIDKKNVIQKKDKNKRYAFFSNEFIWDQKKNYRFSFF